MRIVSIITAIIVAGLLYLLVMERETLMAWTGAEAPAETDVPEEAQVDTATAIQNVTVNSVRVMARRSVAQELDSAVILRGETQAVRQVEVRAETSGKVVSDPLRNGTLVEAGQLLCEIDPGTREVSKREALAKLAEAKALLPESRARLAEAKAQVPAAEAAILEAEANIPAAEAALSEARAGVPAAEAALTEAEARVPEVESRLIEAESRVPEAKARLREAEAAVPAAQAALEEAQSRVPEAEARVQQAEAQVREAEINLNASQSLARDGFTAQTRLASAEAAFETAKAQVQTAQAGLLAAASGIQAAKSNVETARASVQAAQSGIRNAEAGVIAARTQIANAKAGVQSARSQIEGARARVSSALSGVEGAKTAIASTKSQLEGAQAGVQAAMTGEETALSAIQSAEAGVAAADTEIDRLSIHAPFGGLLETDTAELGALMQPGSACATVIQLNPVKIVAYAPEASVARIEVGAQAGARLVSGREVTGDVSFVSRSADPATRTFRVELEVPNEDLSIRDGQTADIAIEAEGAQAHLVPQSALTLNDEGDLGLRTVSDTETAAFMPVTVLRDTRQGVWVTGLPDTVDIIILGQEYVTDGVPLAPSFEEVIQ
ncbi:efflux RND transporter periplasmic adaptor subunit [Sagittula sp. NFXS13]|uniref:efflux RND transporter periplasmic adaptor subunit n=1 Tax=Sagittula sp. NFXS13 TaxID=2819095 RepID=UPI0032E04F5A